MSPALSLLFSPPAAIASMSLIELPALLYLLPQAWRHGEWRSVVPLGLAGVSTVPVGSWKHAWRIFSAVPVAAFGIRFDEKGPGR